MASKTRDKRGGKGFCPFCGSEFAGGRDECPNCGQDIRRYNDDLGPVLDKIQTVTNIDMKSTKVRVAMSVVIFLVVFTGVLAVLEFTDTNSSIVAEEPQIPEGIVVDIKTNGYLDLTGDFAAGNLEVLPLYEPSLRLQLSLKKGLEEEYEKVMWVVETESYNDNYTKNPFYTKVTKEKNGSTDIGSVTWEGLRVGRFVVTADCYREDGSYDVYEGYGTYYGQYTNTYEWNYGGFKFAVNYTMSADDVMSCLNYDLTERMDLQDKNGMASMVVVDRAIVDLGSALRDSYLSRYSNTQYGYADFVLSFVQNCFPDVYDSFNYRVNDYWAYPKETVFWGCGDNEDRAILYCALMKHTLNSKGIEVALLHLPETTIAALQIDMSQSFVKDPVTVRGLYHTYVVADTSSDLDLGLIRSAYDVSDDGRLLYFNGEEVMGHYGLEIA